MQEYQTKFQAILIFLIGMEFKHVKSNRTMIFDNECLNLQKTESD